MTDMDCFILKIIFRFKLQKQEIITCVCAIMTQTHTPFRGGSIRNPWPPFRAQYTTVILGLPSWLNTQRSRRMHLTANNSCLTFHAEENTSTHGTAVQSPEANLRFTHICIKERFGVHKILFLQKTEMRRQTGMVIPVSSPTFVPRVRGRYKNHVHFNLFPLQTFSSISLVAK